MEEKLVNLEVAATLYKKGFNEQTRMGYDENDNIVKPYFGEYCVNSDAENNFLFSAPTQAQAQKWLREKHGIIVLVYYYYEYDSTPYTFFIYKEGEAEKINVWRNDFSTYEEALEAGIFEGLIYVENKV